MRFVVVTGMSGGGKSTALHMLEDVGFYCVDNLPVPLIEQFVELIAMPGSEVEKVALGLDVRVDQPFEDAQKALEKLKKNGYNFELKEEIDRIFVKNEEYNSLMVTILSFGFKHGIPADADLVFDVRFLPNPYYIEELKYKTGNDKEVQDYVMDFPEAGIFIDKLTDMLEFLIPNYVKEGKYQLVIGIGCTGGKHRSVTLANKLYERLKNKGNYGLKIAHRDVRAQGI